VIFEEQRSNVIEKNFQCLKHIRNAHYIKSQKDYFKKSEGQL